MVVLLGGVSAAQEFEHAVQLFLLDSLNLDCFEDFGGACLQFLHGSNIFDF